MSEYANQVQAHKARQRRFAEAAARYLDRTKPPAPPSVADLEPQGFDVWLCRQEYLHPLPPPAPKEPWFHITGENGPPKISAIIRAVCHHFDVPRIELLSPRRDIGIVRPRQIGYYLVKKLTKTALPEIGRRFGGRDHTTALAGIRKIEALREMDTKIDSDIRAIANALGVQNV